MVAWKHVGVMTVLVAIAMGSGAAWAESGASASLGGSSGSGFLSQAWLSNYEQHQRLSWQETCGGDASTCRRRRKRWLSPLERERRSARKMKIAGWIMFGSAYGTNVIVGGLLYAALQHPMLATTFIPVVGPVFTGIYIFQRLLIEPGSAYGLEIIANLFIGMWAVANFVFAIAQFTGLILAIVGHTRENRLRGEVADDDPSLGRTWQIAPWVTHDSAGLAVAGRF